jgi:hypothetical protein
VEAVALDLVHRGCRDLLLLSYNGRDPAMHLFRAQSDALAARVARLSRALGGRARVKLDVCWGERMEAVPQLFGTRPCAAGREFVVLTSDRRMSACSFHHRSFAVASADDVLRVWRDERDALASPAEQPGCARAAGFGLDGTAKPRALPVV